MVVDESVVLGGWLNLIARGEAARQGQEEVFVARDAEREVDAPPVCPGYVGTAGENSRVAMKLGLCDRQIAVENSSVASVLAVQERADDGWSRCASARLRRS